MHDAFFQSPKPTGSADANLQYIGIIDDGETKVLTPSAEKLDDMNGLAHQVRFTGSMRYCTIETLPVDELASYTASFIDSNFIDEGSTAISSTYGNQAVLLQPDLDDTNLGSWIKSDNSITKNFWQENIANNDETNFNGCQINASIRTGTTSQRTVKQVRLLTKNDYPHDVLVTPKLQLQLSQSYASSPAGRPIQNSGSFTNAIEVAAAFFEPTTENEVESRILDYITNKTITVPSSSITNNEKISFKFNPIKVRAYENTGLVFQCKSLAPTLQASSSTSSSIVNTVVSASVDTLQNLTPGDVEVTMNNLVTNASGASFWQAQQAAGLKIFVGRSPAVLDDYREGSSVKAGFLGEIHGSSFSGDVTPLSGSAQVRTAFEAGGVFYTNANADAVLTVVSSSTVIHNNSFPLEGRLNIKLSNVNLTYEIEKVCHRASHELIDNCRKSSIFDTLVFHYSGSKNIANKLDRDFDAAISESKYLYYSRSLTPSCYRDDFYRYSIQRMSTLGSQLTAPSVNSPSVNAALGNLPVIEIFEVNPNQIFFNKTPRQPARNNRLDPGNLSVR